MLVVKIELHSAVTGKITTIGETVIANVGGTADRGDYVAWVLKRGGKKSLRERMHTPIRKSEVKNYPRLSYNVWRLIIRALLAAFPEEKAK